MSEIPKVVCHYCGGKGVIPEEGYADCPYCEDGFEDDPDFIDYEIGEEEPDCDNVEGGCGCCPYDEPICAKYFEGEQES